MKNELNLGDKPSLRDYQEYVAKMVEQRGFDHRNVVAQFLKFTEEVGELAKVIRKSEKMGIDKNSHVGDVSEELADIFIYLIHFCNYYNIDLEKAFRDKEEVNKKRSWKVK